MHDFKYTVVYELRPPPLKGHAVPRWSSESMPYVTP